MFRAILFLLQITERYHPLALRHFLISAHYRSPLNYSIAQLETSSDAVYYIFQVSGLLRVFA
jgi:cysteinyl-tRNA synthetase